tara:strand:- start:3564 stop:3797 length:234 start_codon:yes stop_codon:yes gene_type:complete
MLAPSIYKCAANIANLGDWDHTEDFFPLGIDIYGCGVMGVRYWADDWLGQAYLEEDNVLYGPEAPLPGDEDPDELPF